MVVVEYDETWGAWLPRSLFKAKRALNTLKLPRFLSVLLFLLFHCLLLLLLLGFSATTAGSRCRGRGATATPAAAGSELPKAS